MHWSSSDMCCIASAEQFQDNGFSSFPKTVLVKKADFNLHVEGQQDPRHNKHHKCGFIDSPLLCFPGTSLSPDYILKVLPNIEITSRLLHSNYLRNEGKQQHRRGREESYDTGVNMGWVIHLHRQQQQAVSGFA